MSILPIFGCIRSFCFPLSFLAFSFSITVARIFSIPVAWMKSGSWNGGFSTPRLPCKNLRFWHQWRGTAIVLRYDFRWTSSRGSPAVTSHCSITSGLSTSCFNSAIVSRLSFFFCFFDIFCSPSSSACAAGTLETVSLSASAASSPVTPVVSSSAVENFSKTDLSSFIAGVESSSSVCETYTTCTSSFDAKGAADESLLLPAVDTESPSARAARALESAFLLAFFRSLRRLFRSALRFEATDSVSVPVSVPACVASESDSRSEALSPFAFTGSSLISARTHCRSAQTLAARRGW
mmetsp:Transcript_27439/g.64017  ORF Transcript_27439/g.64017 Transcript_27439/m.64017 type:complete len:294 (-) Transcript_27439:13-894(-)